MKDTGYRESQAADMLSGLPFWEHLEHAQKKYAEDQAVFRHYGKGSMIYSSGSLCLGMRAEGQRPGIPALGRGAGDHAVPPGKGGSLRVVRRLRHQPDYL